MKYTKNKIEHILELPKGVEITSVKAFFSGNVDAIFIVFRPNIHRETLIQMLKDMASQLEKQ